MLTGKLCGRSFIRGFLIEMENKDCVFCKIVNKKIPAEVIYEDDKCLVIPDKFPATKGQSLVITKKHEDYIMNLDSKVYQHIFNVARKISLAIDKAFDTERTCIVVEGFEVPHVHIRLHPAYEKRLLTSGFEEGIIELKKVVNKIKENL